ncbi:MAG: hypothetical protein JWQ04_2787 [Pedosphaera sp.]|nr:hypothetical protein [Pedosphaera sp.]
MNLTLPDPAAVQAIYDFKNILEKAIAAVFCAANLTMLTSASTPDFQSKIPRTELKVSIGAGTKHGFAVVGTIKFNATFNGSFTVRAFTRPDGPGKLLHAAYRSQVFYLCHALPAYINGTDGGLSQHRIYDPITLASTGDVFKTSEGLEYSDQTFNFDFSVNPGAFQTLAV